MDQAWALEESFWEAGTQGDLESHYSHVMTSDAFVVLPGRVMAREDLLRHWHDRPGWAGYELSDRRIVLVNGETVLLSYHVVVHGSTGAVYRARISSVYVWITGWALTFRQHTPDPESTAALGLDTMDEPGPAGAAPDPLAG